ncbi:MULTISPECIES: GNAT family N-acetyltransferase [unclassified Streptomyces]|uniref:GNAT family N-acetyltransferase n=1 Tax=unclassified Streptomyces TaxID=2593676 RepID=UPI0022560ECC|nr:GNAT family N-acetyltransferase [Streptomyces sp. NBC_01571]MCX4573466.1 GNAT family N-acetyltransferase [Streptomyces sp. NBC_01571]
MLAMRPATPEDRRALEAMIQARSEWMKSKQLSNWSSWGQHVQDLAGNCTRRDGDMWVLVEDHRRIIGCTTILRTAAPWAWTTAEAEETSFYLNGTVTDPAERHRKLGTLIADWAVDRAARENISWVRRDCTSPALAAYYEKQEFTLVREVSTPGGRTSYAFERKSERVTSLAGWLITGESPTAISRRRGDSLAGTARSNAAEARRFLSRSLRGSAKTPVPIN